jgi:mitotic-spindle organizing protein 1|eukprot:CAMPEP_0198290464 /NCGR_PEP_ID=MMETSP1449-20131203/8325_1 /TAXON_ID=420275 /ORGANISM="Attheya septentrionalis, Strain CCMP2084" /LENGTH=69 /DNA_ID=CAMNT_0043988973 /DNA_START=257 /DNA_END=466 /DNA_ORIENTATION=-
MSRPSEKKNMSDPADVPLSSNPQVMDICMELSDLLETGLEDAALAAMMDLLQQGVEPEALAAVVQELRK